MTNSASATASSSTDEPDWIKQDPFGLDMPYDDEGHEESEAIALSLEENANQVEQPTHVHAQGNLDGLPSAPPLMITAAQHPYHPQGLRQLVLDTETTGIEVHAGDRVIEIGIIEMVDRKVTGSSLHVYLNPERDVGDSFRIHGLSNDFLADKPKFSDIAQTLLDYIGHSDLIAHNSSFDLRFLDAELSRLKLPLLSSRCKIIDSLAIAKAKHPTQKNNLDALVRRYEIAERDRTYHGALLDAQILTDVYLRMTGGQVNLVMGDEATTVNGRYVNKKFDHVKQTPVITASSEALAAHTAWLGQQKNKEQFIFWQHTQLPPH